MGVCVCDGQVCVLLQVLMCQVTCCVAEDQQFQWTEKVQDIFVWSVSE